ncbi:MAG: hypothetical protein CMF50_07800 [Legionellales bacterium]|nr:hypothetical protein [Legionellales bacterium]|tara:strand:+ start:12180 stop:12662 length:483 start_codon:yes stop_codon:yes gene_type:complete
MNYKCVITICAILCLGGCSTDKVAPTANNPRTADPAEAKLAEAAQSVSQSLQKLGEIQEATTPPPNTFQPPDPATYGMANLVSINWTGPVEPFLHQVADSTGYKVKVLGREPAIPVIVSISESNMPIGDILRNAGYQVGKRASIVVFPNTHTIELRYKQT